jgi:Fe(3+) dicitrate transport protein
VAEEEGEAEEETPGELEIEEINYFPDPARDSTSSFNALPGIAFAYTGLYRSTVYGGYHRGLTTAVLRNEDFPADDEIGDNFNIGLRSSAIKGFDFEVAGFYQLFENFQYGESFSAITGDRVFGRADEVENSGIELYGRLNSQPFTGGPLNLFAEGNYTYARSILKNAAGVDENGDPEPGEYNGNRVPEVPWHVAALTLGVEGTTGWRWNASTTWTYRGSFFTDAGNTPYGLGGEYECDDVAGECEIEEVGEGGGVPSVWLLSARFNLDIGDTGASVFVAGDNLLDEFYITDREDGMKPGLGRTVWTGFKYTF